jgi:DNA-binding PadR family transcriptional regulator
LGCFCLRQLYQPCPSASRSKMEYQLTTTGKERLEYAKWKSQQDQIDQERVRRQKNEAGEWRREWDRNKVALEYVWRNSFL